MHYTIQRVPEEQRRGASKHMEMSMDNTINERYKARDSSLDVHLRFGFHNFPNRSPVVVGEAVTGDLSAFDVDDGRMIFGLDPLSLVDAKVFDFRLLLLRLTGELGVDAKDWL